jgi:ribosomal RNA-processing protein 8
LGEAHRLLKPHGILKIAEVSSRITDAEGWDRLLHALGFDEVARDSSNTHFVLFDYVKSDRPSASLPAVALKPCVYKKR